MSEISIEDIASLSERFWTFYLDGEFTSTLTHCTEGMLEHVSQVLV